MPTHNWKPDILPDDPRYRQQQASEADAEQAKADARQRYSARVFEVIAAYRRLVAGKGERDDDKT